MQILQFESHPRKFSQRNLVVLHPPKCYKILTFYQSERVSPLKTFPAVLYSITELYTLTSKYSTSSEVVQRLS